MATPVKGKDVMFEVYSSVADDYVYLTCAEGVSMSFTPELIEKTTVSSGAGYDWHERRRGWTVTVTGIGDIDSTGRTIFTMVDPGEINTAYQVRVSYEDALGNTAVFSGSVKMDSTTLDAIQTGFVDFDITLRGIGMYDLVQTIGGVVGGSLFKILMESGDELLNEVGDNLLLENG